MDKFMSQEDIEKSLAESLRKSIEESEQWKKFRLDCEDTYEEGIYE